MDTSLKIYIFINYYYWNETLGTETGVSIEHVTGKGYCIIKHKSQSDNEMQI